MKALEVPDNLGIGLARQHARLFTERISNQMQASQDSTHSTGHDPTEGNQDMSFYIRSRRHPLASHFSFLFVSLFSNVISSYKNEMGPLINIDPFLTETDMSRANMCGLTSPSAQRLLTSYGESSDSKEYSFT